MYLDGRRLFRVFVTGPDEALGGKGVEKFFDSFKILPIGKNEDKPKAAETPDKDDRLLGLWQLQSREGSPHLARQVRLAYFGDRTATIGEDVGPDLKPAPPKSYRVFPDRNPKAIDLTLGDRTWRGIYMINGDALELCFAAEGEPRPTLFSALPIELRLTPKLGDRPRRTPEGLELPPPARPDHLVFTKIGAKP